ncbi:MAG: hypothetical protein HYS63_03725 [Methylocystis sp.]|nr:hypothetical protein [Methylocystis sp.]
MREANDELRLNFAHSIEDEVISRRNQRSTKHANHHRIFDVFDAYDGRMERGYAYDFIGSMTNLSLVYGLKDTIFPESDSHRKACLPAFDEEYFEWIDLLESVHDAGDAFVIAEVGAGYGRWAARGVCAARQKGVPRTKAILVEADPLHARFAREHMSLNGLCPGDLYLHESAAAARNETTLFAVEAPKGFLPEGAAWYGQAIFGPAGEDQLQSTGVSHFGKPLLRRSDGWGVIEVGSMTLAEALASHELIDLVDMDIQGAEAEVIETSADCLNSKVKRLHIGTHGSSIEDRLRRALTAQGWTCLWDYPCQAETETSYGRVRFNDGVQSWINPRLHASSLRAA